MRGPRWLNFFLPGAALGLATVALVVIFGFLDLIISGRFRSIAQLLTPDPVAAAGTLGLAGGAEGAAIGIVLVVVVLGITMTASRYSPRIIDVFVGDPVNGLVLGLFLGSILFTFLVRAELKTDFVPTLGVIAAVVLAFVDFVILLPYVAYIFDVMRAETLVVSIRRSARSNLHKAIRGRSPVVRRQHFLTSVAQIADIAAGSVRQADVPVSMAAIDSLSELLVWEYLPGKARLPEAWFEVGRQDLLGHSDQVVEHMVRNRTWLEHLVLSTFLDMIGMTPVYQKEVVHAIATATCQIGQAALKSRDKEIQDLVVRYFNTYLRAALNQHVPAFAYSSMNEYRHLARACLDSRPELAVEIAGHLLDYGRFFEEERMTQVRGAAVEDVSELAVAAEPLAPEVSRRLAALVASQLGTDARPSLVKPVLRLALWARHGGHVETGKLLRGALSRVPLPVLTDCLERLQSTEDGVFREVNERLVAFDWVPDELRGDIAGLRAELAAAGDGSPQRAISRQP